ncbi:DeoR/GlpR family DNA-binding transcription regulator [Paenibacillus popilliae]|nr:DeoR/GlpR family DNA-binding transcription regulator [Paenibacillus popilliae]
MFPAERKSKILEYLKKQQRATVKELSCLVGVSEATLRSDLQVMEEEGSLQRTHGGAMIADDMQTDTSFAVREKRNNAEKSAIGSKAAMLPQDGECILLDASSTALEMAKALKNRQIRLIVVTNGIYTALELKENPNFTVIVVGGVIRAGSAGLEGMLGSSVLNQIHMDTMYTSAHGFTLEDGMMDFNVYEVELKRAMIQASSQVIALLDHTKLDKRSISSFASAQDIAAMIMDSKAPQSFIDQLQQQKIKVDIVPPNVYTN